MAAMTLTADNFERTITENELVLVDFWAAWCGPCRQFAPVYEKASLTHPGIVFGKVDTEAERSLAQAAQITSIPTKTLRTKIVSQTMGSLTAAPRSRRGTRQVRPPEAARRPAGPRSPRGSVRARSGGRA